MFDTLVLSGGSYKGYSYIGFLRKLEETGIRANIKNISACSVGSIFGLLMVLGLSSSEMIDIMKKYDIRRAYQFDIKSLISHYGLCDFVKIRNIISGMMSEKGVNSSVTFKNLYDITKINLVINATCVETNSTVYFNWENSPDMEVLGAIQMSCAIPFLFVKNEYRGLTYVDGGILDNLPYTPFQHKDKNQVLSVYLKETPTTTDLGTLDGYLLTIVNLISANYSKLKERYLFPDSYVVKISVPVNMLTLHISDKFAMELIENGYQQTTYYFSLWRAKYGFKYPNEMCQEQRTSTDHSGDEPPLVILEKQEEPKTKFKLKLRYTKRYDISQREHDLNS